MVNISLRHKVINLLKTNKLINMIDFYFSEGDSYHIDGTGFREVATNIEKNRIIVIVDPNKIEKIQVKGETKITEGSYLYALNIMVFRDSNPEPDVIVHEATHALLDIRKAYIRNKTNEAVAFLAQVIYKRLESDLGEKLSTGRIAFLNSAALAAAAVVAEKAKILSYAYPQGSDRSKNSEYLKYKKGVYLEKAHLDEIRKGVTEAGYTNDDKVEKKHQGLDIVVPTVKIEGAVPDPGPSKNWIKRR